VRLQKFLALQTASSRRRAEELIISGFVTVNGEVAKIGSSIDPESDVVAVNENIVSNKSAIRTASPLVLLMNKPTGYVCSHSDRYNPETIFNLIPREFSRKKLMFCGRLDKETAGMLIITDSGDFAQRLSHPSFGIRKHYEATLTRPLPENALRLLLSGIEDAGDFIKFDKIIPIGRGRMKNFVLEIVLSQGKKNEIRRAAEHFGVFVEKLKRVRIGGLPLRGVAVGKCRKLSEKEIEMLLCEKSRSRKVQVRKNISLNH
jgi:23S rRNA pseudouridine2605 synthase